MSEEKQPEAKEIARSQPRVEYLQPESGLPSVYTNNVAISPNVFDLRIYFGELVQASPAEIKIAQKIEVIMPWLEAKIFASFIQKHVDAFEKANGPIKYPKQPGEPEPHNPFAPGEADLIHTRSAKPSA